MNPPPYNRKYTYEQIEKQTQPNGNRIYRTPAGAVESVTTILSKTAEKEALDNWRERVGEEEANRQTANASNIGNILHDHMETWLKGRDRPDGKNMPHKIAKGMSEKIINYISQNVDEVWGIEEPLYYPDLYAGTADLIGIHQGQPFIGDFKNSKKIKKKEWIEDYFLQGCAYAIAHNYHYGTNIKKVVIMMADRETNFQEFVIQDDEFENYAMAWTERLSYFFEMNPLPD